MIGAWEFVKRHPEVLTDWVVEHLVISLTAIAMGAILGCALGFFITGKGREGLAEGILYIAEIMMTVPSLALFGFAMLLLGHLGLNAIGFLPAVITLVVYGQLPILRNTYTAIREVDPAMMEAGKALGMSQRQLLFKVKLPLALPVIVAGLRNSMVLTIGICWRAWRSDLSGTEKRADGPGHCWRFFCLCPGIARRWLYGGTGTLDDPTRPERLSQR
jgi:osmoprotectant transport system permease protein